MKRIKPTDPIPRVHVVVFGADGKANPNWRLSHDGKYRQGEQSEPTDGRRRHDHETE